MTKSWTISGFGIRTDILEAVDVETEIAFLEKFLPNRYGELQNAVKENGRDMQNTSDYLDFCDKWICDHEDYNGYTGFPPMFAEAITANEKGFPVTYYSGLYPEENSIIHDDCQPWEMSERERNMSREDMIHIFETYLQEVGIELVVFDRQTIEFYG